MSIPLPLSHDEDRRPRQRDRRSSQHSGTLNTSLFPTFSPLPIISIALVAHACIPPFKCTIGGNTYSPVRNSSPNNGHTVSRPKLEPRVSFPSCYKATSISTTNREDSGKDSRHDTAQTQSSLLSHPPAWVYSQAAQKQPSRPCPPTARPARGYLASRRHPAPFSILFLLAQFESGRQPLQCDNQRTCTPIVNTKLK